jgi:hypothetical protein
MFRALTNATASNGAVYRLFLVQVSLILFSWIFQLKLLKSRYEMRLQQQQRKPMHPIQKKTI